MRRAGRAGGACGWSPVRVRGPSRLLVQLAGTVGCSHFADHPDTAKRCAGRLQPKRRLEHVILQDIPTCVGPVIRDLARVVVAHQVRGRTASAARIRGPRALAVLDPAGDPLPDEAVHLPAVDVANGVRRAVRTADIPIVGIVERPHAAVGERIGHAHRRSSVRHRIPSAPGYVPKYESNERFSCMIMITCLIAWMGAGSAGRDTTTAPHEVETRASRPTAASATDGSTSCLAALTSFGTLPSGYVHDNGRPPT